MVLRVSRQRSCLMEAVNLVPAGAKAALTAPSPLSDRAACPGRVEPFILLGPALCRSQLLSCERGGGVGTPSGAPGFTCSTETFQIFSFKEVEYALSCEMLRFPLRLVGPTQNHFGLITAKKSKSFSSTEETCAHRLWKFL